MKHVRLLALFILILAMASSAAAAVAESGHQGYLGQPLNDFTVELIDGGTFTLSDALADHEAVLINLWATWCDPCRSEFGYMQEAYEQYKDRVAVVALSIEPADTLESLADFAKENGMTFPVGRDTAGLANYFGVSGIPFSAMVDRFGNVTFGMAGAQPSTEAFTQLFEAFVGDGYSETVTYTALPPARPDVTPAGEGELSAAANAEGGQLVFRNAEDAAIWPMLPVEADGRSALVSTNAGKAGTVAAVRATVTAEEGDALGFEFRTSTEAAMDLLEVAIDGEKTKAFGGARDWTAWAVALPKGEHEIAFSYSKDDMVDEGDDCVWLDEVRVLSGAEAEAALAGLPQAHAAEALSVRLEGEGVQEVRFSDPDGAVEELFSSESLWIVPADRVDVKIDLPREVDPERAFIYSTLDGSVGALSGAQEENGYAMGLDMSKLSNGSQNYGIVFFYAGLRSEDAGNRRGMLVLRDAETVDKLLNALAEDGYDVRLDSGDANETAAAEAAYTVTFLDQNGDGVPGCVVNFCTDETCQTVVADDEGVARFAGAPYAYHLQVLKAPEGYTIDTAREYYTAEAGDDLVIQVHRD